MLPLWFLFLPNVVQSDNRTSPNVSFARHDETFKLIDWKLEELKNYFIYASFILIVVVMKVAYFRIPKLSSYFPESCVLVIVGITFGLFIRFLLKKENMMYFKLTPHVFFYVLLPPIVLESAYSLYHRNFLDNLLSILAFAVIGTLLNFLIIGFALWGLAQFGDIQTLNLSLMHCLLFSSLIVAVDPVAVLAIFKEVGVNQDLYYLVFGESLLNDAVTVVLYEMMEEFSLMEYVSGKNIVLGILSFFTISFGGIIIGVVIGVLGCLILRSMTNKSTELLEPILLLTIGYLSYLLASIFGWSGIIAMTACGLVQAAYALYGIDEKSRVTLKRFIKILSSICEALIFLFLGVELVVGKHHWYTGFSLSALFLCLTARFIVTFILSGLINKIHMSLHSIPLREKIIISYGGLRGAVAFSLAVLIREDVLKNTVLTKDSIITTTMFIILFTILVQGITIKPFVNVLKITRQTKVIRLSLLDELNDSVMDATTTGIEGILGKCGQSYFIMRLEKFNATYIQPFLQRPQTGYDRMISINDKINITILSTLGDKSSTHFHALPNSYKNLLNAITQPPPKPVLRQKKQKILKHAMSDFTGQSYGKKIKRLQPFLIRASAISHGHDEDVWETRTQLDTFFQKSNAVIKAKDKFLNLRLRSQHQQEETMNLTERNQRDDTHKTV